MPDQYPAWRYHSQLPAKHIHNAEEDAALGSGWYRTPGEVMPDITAEPVPPPKEPGPVTVDEETSEAP